MRPHKLLLAAFAAAAIAAGCGGAGGGSRSPLPEGAAVSGPASGSKIQHVVIIVQENRTFDNFFDCFPGTDCVKTAPGAGPQPGPTTPSSPCPDAVASPTPGPTPRPIKLKFNAKLWNYDPDHSYCPAFRVEYDGGRMDGFYWAGGIVQGQPDGKRVYEVVAPSQIRPYWDLAQQYVLGDRMFPTQSSGSFTAHQDIIRGSTQLRSDAYAVDFPWHGGKGTSNWGCDSPTQTYTPLLTDTLKYIMHGPFPCFKYETMRDTLDAAGVTWKYYVPVWPDAGGQMWNAFDAISAVRYGNDGEWPPKFKPFDCTRSCVSWPESNVLCDLGASASNPCPSPSPSGPVVLPAVSWVIPDGEDSDHFSPLGDNGPDWVATVVNAIGKSKNWDSTAIFIVWDDWGGWYDHVPPPQLDYTGLGLRVPFIIVSPYAKKGYLDHTQYEFGSILKFVESTFGLPSLNTTDVRANAIVSPFDFTQKPRKFVPINLIKHGHDARYFLTRPPSGLPVDTE